MPALLADAFNSSEWRSLVQYCINGLSIGMLYALIALGYTMVYGIIELINFAHGDLFMLGTFCGLTILNVMGLTGTCAPNAGTSKVLLACLIMLLLVPAFCASVNWSVDRV